MGQGGGDGRKLSSLGGETTVQGPKQYHRIPSIEYRGKSCRCVRNVFMEYGVNQMKNHHFVPSMAATWL